MARPPVMSRATTKPRWRAAPRAARTVTPKTERPEAVAQSPPLQQPPHPRELDTITARWQLALDAAEWAIGAPGNLLPRSELVRRRNSLARERRQTAELLRRVAKVTRVRPEPWLSPVPLRATMLGLPATIKACLFDLEGVLTDSAVLHALAWGEVFDDFLLRLADKTGWQFIPFDRDFDYRTYLDGRPRLEGVHAFLDSRGIRLPEGRLGDPEGADTAAGLARRKGDALARRLRQRGVTALPGARRYLEVAGQAGLARAVVSASASTLPMLQLAGLATLVEERVDADVIRAEGLRARPAPDLLLVACRRLGVRPEDAVTFTHSAAGIAAGRAAGLIVIGVGDGPDEELLRGFGAERVVPSVSTLLAPLLAAPVESGL